MKRTPNNPTQDSKEIDTMSQKNQRIKDKFPNIQTAYTKTDLNAFLREPAGYVMEFSYLLDPRHDHIIQIEVCYPTQLSTCPEPRYYITLSRLFNSFWQKASGLTFDGTPQITLLVGDETKADQTNETISDTQTIQIDKLKTNLVNINTLSIGDKIFRPCNLILDGKERELGIWTLIEKEIGKSTTQYLFENNFFYKPAFIKITSSLINQVKIKKIEPNSLEETMATKILRYCQALGDTSVYHRPE